MSGGKTVAWRRAEALSARVFRLARRAKLRHGCRMFDPVEKLKEFIRHASISTDPKAKDGMKGAQEFVSGLLRSLGFSVDVVHTELHPVIFAQRGGDKSWPHVLIYGHYDVQPADPLNLWKTPAFEPTIVGTGSSVAGRRTTKGR